MLANASNIEIASCAAMRRLGRVNFFCLVLGV
jgi:hypothetical protein